MEAVARRRMQREGKAKRRAAPLVAAAVPTLGPGMLLPRKRRAAAPFPFDDPTTHWFYFARNGIFALARLWGLAGSEVLFPAYFHGVEL